MAQPRVARFCAAQIRAGAHVTMAFFKLHSRLYMLCCWRFLTVRAAQEP